WHRVRDETVQRPAFLQQMRRLQGRFYLAFEEGLSCAKAAGMCDDLLKKFDTLFEFTHSTTNAIEPTNNAAERSLRHAVILEHLSFGTQSEA
ncbi:IS66 family transposase, partial [Escherichia coli]|nr:IS66 family transposase [Escherichia coli]